MYTLEINYYNNIAYMHSTLYTYCGVQMNNNDNKIIIISIKSAGMLYKPRKQSVDWDTQTTITLVHMRDEH